MKNRLGFTPLEKAADFSRRLSSDKADGGLRHQSAQTVRERSSLTGFTLIELMIVLLLLSTVVMGLSSSMSSGRKAFYVADAQISIQDELQKAMRQITFDLRQSSPNKISLPADGIAYSNISFNVSTGVSGLVINWSAAPVNYTLLNGQIVRDDGTETRIVANNVTTLTFTRLASASSIVKINLSVQKSTPFGNIFNSSLDTAVNLRNQ
jgi:prepilin-type N-terminal cleavage/methylation domain-containing protein